MAVTVATPPEVSAKGARRPQSSLRFDWLMLAVSLWPLVGALADSWAHINLPTAETFFTPWHDVLYSGLLVVGLANSIVLWRNHAAGFSWRNAVAPGYGLTLVGVAVLAVGGVGDLIWHSLFGIEKDIAATVSPSHLLIITGIVLVLAGPLRSALSRPASQRLRGLSQLPLVLSASLVYTMISIVTQFASPYSYRWAFFGDINLFTDHRPADPYLTQSLGLASVVLQAVILSVMAQTLLRGWRLFPGALTILITLPVLAEGGTQQDLTMLPAALAAGVAADVLAILLRPSPERPTLFRLFAFALPALVYLAYFDELLLLGGIKWPIHLWIGCIFAAGSIGLVLSYLTLGPASRVDTAADSHAYLTAELPMADA